MSDEIFFDGLRYISAAEAASRADFTRDYIARLCRMGKIGARRIGKNWYVHDVSLGQFLAEQEALKLQRRQRLSEERVEEYHTHRSYVALDGAGTQSRRIALYAFGAQPEAIRLRASAVTISLAKHVACARERMEAKVSLHGGAAVRYAPSIFASPSGLHEAVTRSVEHSTLHVPVYALTPLAEFLQRFVALFIAFTVTFGTYMLVDPSRARFAMDSFAHVSSTILSLMPDTIRARAAPSGRQNLSKDASVGQ